MTISYTEDGIIKTYVSGEHGFISLPENKNIVKVTEETKKFDRNHILSATYGKADVTEKVRDLYLNGT